MVPKDRPIRAMTMFSTFLRNACPLWNCTASSISLGSGIFESDKTNPIEGSLTKWLGDSLSLEVKASGGVHIASAEYIWYHEGGWL